MSDLLDELSSYILHYYTDYVVWSRYLKIDFLDSLSNSKIRKIYFFCLKSTFGLGTII